MKHICTFLLLLLALGSHAQNIVKAEYFLDTDPGYGNGTNIPVSPATDVTLNFTAPISTPGFHFLFVRAEDANGYWGITNYHAVYSASINTGAAAAIAYLEYYIDTDPGRGSGTPISFSASNDVTTSFTAVISSISSGIHFLYVRGKDVNGNWSVYNYKVFYNSYISPSASITQVEYFIDNDPGRGNAAQVPSVAGNYSFNADLTGITTGFHFLYVRGKDADGNWSIYNYKTIFVDAPSTNGNIVAAEYFWDTDPGRGSGTTITIAPATDVTKSFSASAASLSGGIHFLYVRGKDQAGKWSIANYRLVYLESPGTTITATEYFWDSDPGRGNGTPIAVSPASDITKSFSATTAGLSRGIHFLYTRGKDDMGKWSIVNYKAVYIEPQVTFVTYLEYFWDTDPGYGNATSIAITSAADVTKSFTASMVGLTSGTHFLHCRAKNNAGMWSETAYRMILKEANGETDPAANIKVDKIEYFVTKSGGAIVVPTQTYTGFTPATDINVTFNPVMCIDTAGTYYLWIHGIDSKTGYGSYYVDPITITSPSEPPALSHAIASQSLTYNFSPFALADLDTVITDPDLPYDHLTYTYTTDQGKVTASINASTNVLTLSSVLNQTGNDSLRITATDTCGNSYTHVVYIFINGPISWNGSVSGDWNTAANWAPATIPNACSASITIPSGTPHDPVICNSNVSVGDITVASGVTIDLQGKDLNICGNWTGGSTTDVIVTGTGKVVLQGSIAETIDGKAQFETLEINNAAGVTLIGTAKINTLLSLHTGILNTTGGTLTFISTSASQCAVIDHFSSGYTGSITGNITAQRFVPTAGSNQHYFSAPVGSVAFTQFGASGNSGYVIPTATCDETQSQAGSPYGTVFEYHEDHGTACSLAGWDVKIGGSTSTAKGYSVYQTGNTTLSLTGSADVGSNYSISGTNSGWNNTTQQGHPLTSGWVLVGNPYLATINLDATHTGYDAQVQVWQTSGPYAGTYQVVMMGSGSAYIAPFQGFMIHKTAVGGSATFDFPKTECTLNTTNFYRQTSTSALNIEVAGAAGNDITYVEFNSDASTQFDNEYDAYKIHSAAGHATLYTTYHTTGASWMSHNVFHTIDETPTVPMGFEPQANGTFTLTFNGISSFDPTSYIWLEDIKTGQWIDVRQHATYTFTASKTDDRNRFVLHFTPPAQIQVTDASCTRGGDIIATQSGTANWYYTLKDSLSHVLNTGTLSATLPINIANVAEGNYTLVLVDSDGYTATKTITVNGMVANAANFTASSNSVNVGDTVTFTNTTANATQNQIQSQWDFGDSTSSTDFNAVHTYQYAGTYTVILASTDRFGCSSLKQFTVTVSDKNNTAIGIIANDLSLKIYSYDDVVAIDFREYKDVDATVQIYNLLGQLLVTDHTTSTNIYTRQVSTYEAAYLLVSVRMKDGKFVNRKVFINSVH